MFISLGACSQGKLLELMSVTYKLMLKQHLPTAAARYLLVWILLY